MEEKVKEKEKESRLCYKPSFVYNCPKTRDSNPRTPQAIRSVGGGQNERRKWG